MNAADGTGALMLEMQNIRHCKPDAGIDPERWITGIVSRAFPRAALKRADWGLVDMAAERTTQQHLQAEKEAEWEREKVARAARRKERLSSAAKGKSGGGTPSRALKRTRSGPAGGSSAAAPPGTNWRKRLRRTLSTPQPRPRSDSRSSVEASGAAAAGGDETVTFMGSTFAAVRNWLTPSKTPRPGKTYTPRGAASGRRAVRHRTPLGEVQRSETGDKVPTPVEMMPMLSSRKRGRDE